MWKLFSNVAGILQNITIKVQVKNEYIYIFFLQALSTEFRETLLHKKPTQNVSHGETHTPGIKALSSHVWNKKIFLNRHFYNTKETTQSPPHPLQNSQSNSENK